MTKRLSERLRLFEEEIFPCDQPIGMSYDGELIYNTAALRRNSICVEGMD